MYLCEMDLELLEKALENITPEEIEKYFPADTKPHGWISIEEHLPEMRAIDIRKGYTKFKVKYEDGSIGRSKVADHCVWYYGAKEAGITHWWNKNK